MSMLANVFGVMAAVSVASPTAPLAPLPTATPVDRAIVSPIKRRTESLGLRTTSPSVFVADVASGRVLFAKDPHRVMPIASLTKVMTAMVFLDSQPDWGKVVEFLAEDFDGESTPVFVIGERMTLREVFDSMLIGSVNASANVLARETGGKPAFVARMNEKARQLNLKSPVFVEPSGIEPANRASAADVAAMLVTGAGYAEIRDVSKRTEVVIPSRIGRKEYRIKSTNLLLTTDLNKNKYRIVTAKTGSLPEAGFCMGQVTTIGPGREVVVVELGNDNHFSRYQDIKNLTYWAFDTYEWR
jgi:D-alanyl-D-alanine endopeptidase (penicillin-binding protein 7)